MLIHKEKLTVTTSSGDASINTRHIRGMCYQILITPVTPTVTFNYAIEDSDGIEVFYRTSEVGEYAELTDLPLRGIYTIKVDSATEDELFKIQLLIRE